MDASSGVTTDDFNREKDFIQALAYRFGISPNGPRGSVVTYATRSNIIAGFKDPDFKRRLQAAKLLGTPRRINNALRKAVEVLTTTKRPKLLVLLIAGGQSSDSNTEPLSQVLKPLQRVGVQVYVVVIGREPNNKYLAPLVSRPKDIYRVPSSRKLPSQVRRLERNGKYVVSVFLD